MHKPGFAIVTLALAGGIAAGVGGGFGALAQDAEPADLAGHPLVGAWVVDTNVDADADAPEIGIFTADGTAFGLGASRWVSGAWEAADDATGAATLVGVFDANGGGYVVLRGPHQVDADGNAWTCPCTFTVVAPDGTVLDSGMATARGVRIPVETVDAAGMPLPGFPSWAPAAMPAATPAT